MKSTVYIFTILLSCFCAISSYSQSEIAGKVVDESGDPIAGATIVGLNEISMCISDKHGYFQCDVNNNIVQVNMIGYSLAKIDLNQIAKDKWKNLSIILSPEQNIFICGVEGIKIPLLSEIIITSIQKSSSTVTTLIDPSTISAAGTADILSSVPGIFSDASTGEVFSRVYSRGVSLSAEDDIGWFYNSLQEDGMPITMINYNQFSPDLFHRPDISSNRVEVYKGGKSGILSANSPGTLINFISRGPNQNDYRLNSALSTGIHQNGQGFFRAEAYYGGPINQSSWSYDVSYLYRYDQGNKNIDYALGKGGQLKGSLYKSFSNGIVSLKMKWLNDQTNRYTGIAATNWKNPEPAFGQSFQNTSLLPPALDGQIPDGRTSGATNYEFDPANGLQTNEWSTLVSGDFEWTDWRVSFKSKVSLKSTDWQTAIGGQPLGLENFITYFVSGDAFPAGIVDFRVAEPGGQPLATVNNAGMLAAFQGQAPSFEYLNGTLPNDAIMGTGAWKKDDQINEWMNDIRATWKQGSVNWTIGAFGSHSAVDVFTNASFIYSTYEPQPRLLEVSLTDFEGNRRQLSDANGLSNYGGLLYEQGEIDVNIYSLYSQYNDRFNDRLYLDLGVRFDHVSHNGLKYNSTPLTSGGGGLDRNEVSGYDNGLLISNGSDLIDFNYNFLSYSAGLSLDLGTDINLYGRFSNTHKSPELNYYLNNFSNVPIEGPGEIQNIAQAEIGLKTQNLQLTAFISSLSNVPYSNFEFDDQTNGIFYTPTQLNSSQTIGVELTYVRPLSNALSIQINATWQNAQLGDFTLYQANGSIDTNDDNIETFSDNKLPHQANLMGNISLNYNLNKWSGSLRYRYLGNRYGNFANSFTLPAYGRVDAVIGYDIDERSDLMLSAHNLFNTAGLNNFFGPNQFGSSSDAASESFISNNPNASFVVFPIGGRTISLRFGYKI